MFLQKTVWIQKKTLDRPCLDNYYRKDPEYAWQESTCLDFQKAFDSVNHRVLLSKLEYYGNRGIPHDLIKSYLTNRKHYTHINGVDSYNLTRTHSIPQGSVLGPPLFLK